MDIIEVELADIHQETIECVDLDSIPLKSKKIYWGQYDRFMSWCLEKNICEYTENVLLSYLNEESKKVKSSTLWAHYSMLKATLAINKNIDVSKYRRVTAFLKRKSDGYQPKKSKIFEKEELEAFFNGAPDKQYLFMKVVAIMGIAGACRMYELANMTIDNIHDVGSAIIVTIPDPGTGMERTFTIKDSRNMRFLQILRKYMDLRPNCDHRRLFVNYIRGKCTVQPVGVNKFGRIPSEIADYLKLPEATGYTGHAFRRTSATLLVNARGNYISPRHLSGWKSATGRLSEGYGENSIKAKLELARKVLGLKWRKEAENNRTSEIAACSSKTPKPQIFSGDGREPSTSCAPDNSKNWATLTQQSSSRMTWTGSYKQFGADTLTKPTSRSNCAGTEFEGVGRHINENSAHKIWEQNESEKDDGDSNTLYDVTNTNLTVMLQRKYGKSAHSVPKTTNISNTDQCTSNNEAENLSFRRASFETTLTDNIRDAEMVLLRLQTEKLLLELDKLKLQRDKMKVEKCNILLRNSVLSLQKQLISIEFSDKGQTASLSIAKICNSNVGTSSSPTDAVDTKSKTDSCDPTVLVQNEEDSDSDIEIEYVSMNQLGVRHSDILGCDKNVKNFPKLQTVRHAENTKQIPRHSFNDIDNISSGITKRTSQKMYPSSDNRAPRHGNTVTSSEEDLVTEVSYTCYRPSDTSESGHNSHAAPVTYDQNPIRINEIEQLSEHENDIGTNVISAMDRSREKDVQKLSPSYQHDLTTFTKSINLHENGSSSGTNNVTGKKRKVEVDIVPSCMDNETLQVHSNVEAQFAFIEIEEPNLVLKKEIDLDFGYGDIGNDSLADISEMGDIQHTDELERIRKSYVDNQYENILQSSSKRILEDTDDANVNKKVKHKSTSL